MASWQRPLAKIDETTPTRNTIHTTASRTGGRGAGDVPESSMIVEANPGSAIARTSWPRRTRWPSDRCFTRTKGSTEPMEEAAADAACAASCSLGRVGRGSGPVLGERAFYNNGEDGRGQLVGYRPRTPGRWSGGAGPEGGEEPRGRTEERPPTDGGRSAAGARVTKSHAFPLQSSMPAGGVDAR